MTSRATARDTNGPYTNTYMPLTKLSVHTCHEKVLKHLYAPHSKFIDAYVILDEFC
jgi:hypothetical protein